jgi:hypothetical protein
MVRPPVWWRKIMSKTRDTSNVGYGAPKDPATLDDHGTLADSELAAVTGGRIFTKHPAAVTIPDLKWLCPPVWWRRSWARATIPRKHANWMMPS